jgi:NAD(P)-dependent dehydrogenase (short-subunit alcohol dehydrogenase family)
MTTILVTGSSRGIGAAIASTLGAMPETRVLGHGTRSGIAVICPRRRARPPLGRGAGTGGRGDRRAGQQCRIFEASPLDADDWSDSWARTIQVNLTASAELCRLAVLHWQARGRAAGSSTSPAAPPIAATRPPIGIMPRPRRHGRDDQDDRAGYAAKASWPLPSAPASP